MTDGYRLIVLSSADVDLIKSGQDVRFSTECGVVVASSTGGSSDDLTVRLEYSCPGDYHAMEEPKENPTRAFFVREKKRYNFRRRRR